MAEIGNVALVAEHEGRAVTLAALLSESIAAYEMTAAEVGPTSSELLLFSTIMQNMQPVAVAELLAHAVRRISKMTEESQ